MTSEHSRLCGAQRRIVAWLGHAPGLWLCYREPLPRELRGPNALAVGATLIAVVVAVLVVDRATAATAALVTWLAGHAAWGTYLAWKLPPRSATATAISPRLGRLHRCAVCTSHSRAPPPEGAGFSP